MPVSTTPTVPRVLYLTPGCFDKGGISRYSRYQIRALRDLFGPQNVQALSLLGPDANSFEEALPDVWAAGGNGRRAKSHFVARSIAAALRFKPHVVHVAHVNLSGLARVLAWLSGGRTLLNTYGLEVWSGFRRDAAWGLRTVDAVLADCHYTAQYLENEGLRPAGSVEVVWDCVDHARFHAAPVDPRVLTRYGLPDPAEHFVVLSLGRLSDDARHKGYERLVAAFARMAPFHPQARLVFAGRGDYVEPLRALAAQHGIGGQVVFTGSVSEEDLPAVYRAASVFSLVSDRGVKRGEGIPLTPLEAMACGAPIIVGNHDGSQEAVVQNRNGFVIDPFDLETHSAILRQIADTPVLRERLSREAVAVSQACFSYDDFRSKHERLYQTHFSHVAHA